MSISTRLVATLLLLASWWPAVAQTTTPAFAKGADISWVTEMEAAGYKFYNKVGAQQDLFQLLQADYGLNTIRLRVWVNPAGGYNGPADVLAKAKRAQALGQRLLIDFHYSDDFADPGKQTKPAAWQSYTVAQLKQAVYDHTFSVLTSLKANGITPEWVQVGNETNDGMLWPEGRLTVNGFGNFAQFVDQGYAAVKAVSPTTKVIAHFANGQNNGAFRYYFDGLQANGARWDVMGLSLYPDGDTWPTFTAQAQANMNDLVSRYPGKEVMVVEVGLDNYIPIATRQMLLDLIAKTQAVPGGKGLGVVYWEPESYNWNGYTKGAWGANNRATAGLDGYLPFVPPLVNNPGFEYTAATQNPLGWTTTSTADADADKTEPGGRPGQVGQFQFTHYKATAYQVTTSQVISNLPNGTYTLRAWVQSGGGQTTCQLYGRSGTAERTLAVPTGTWTQVSVPGIVVANGQCEIGLRSVGAAGNYCNLDDVELVSTALATTPAAAALATQLFPNPGTGPATLAYTLGSASPVRVELYSLTGQLVQVLADLPAQTAGRHELALPVASTLPTGSYLVRIDCGGTRSALRFTKW
ncbi:T9SS type A sorting domain-containing protein [Hymenobacter sp. HMF4947]|uniref:Arabinogalactan endo-beta-1,4-galactanase n=1 Tax=Hymenobacter ginkgonis TaxID=2682976 RepID=A0A7K1TK13_9BACT|nr:glycosyl hydrolase 53 family protein [Hymenobacter ginkgonis]MVN78735.1 T9SS type A sorting domain-containing protein [Hymenobacter ginkgonis]